MTSEKGFKKCYRTRRNNINYYVTENGIQNILYSKDNIRKSIIFQNSQNKLENINS